MNCGAMLVESLKDIEMLLIWYVMSCHAMNNGGITGSSDTFKDEGQLADDCIATYSILDFGRLILEMRGCPSHRNEE